MEAEIPKGRTRETKIRRDAQGRWFNDGVPIAHPNLVAAFNSWLERAEDGRFCLKNSINWAYVAVEGAPRSVRRVRVGNAEITLVLSSGRDEPLVADTLREDREGRLYCDVEDGSMVAVFESAAMGDLADLLHEDDEGIYLEILGRKVRPTLVEDPLDMSRLGR